MLESGFRYAALRAGLRIAGDLVRTWIQPPRMVVGVGPPVAVRLRRGAAPGAGSRPRLRVATWNIHRAYDRDGVARGLHRLLRDLDLDLLLLQEVPVWPEGAWWGHASVRDSLAEHDVCFAPMHRVLRPDRYYPFTESGQAVVSRWPLVGAEATALAPVSRAKLGRNHRVRRVALTAAVQGRPGPFRVINVHLENTARPAGRAAQASEVIHVAEQWSSVPVVLGGDFNDVLGPWEGVDALLRDAGFATPPGSDRGRWPRIDRLYGRGLNLLRSETLDIGGSDHRPVLAELVELPL